MKRDLQRFSMMFIYLLLFVSGIFAQAPAGYYTPAEGLSGDQLKAALHNIIKGHKTFPYTSGSTDVWDILKLSDQDPANSANVILFYTGWSVNAAQEYAGGAGWNREHVWAKSHGPFSEDVQGPGTDCHHLRPADISVNSARNNRYFDYADKEYLDGGVPTGCKTSSTRDVWEPRDGQKGDVAREIFYMATRYEGDDGFPDLEVVDYIPPVDASPLFGVLSTLIEWNQLDPVDSFEMHRNNVVYSFQKNRNPFIDHPEYVNLIWMPSAGSGPVLGNIAHSPDFPDYTNTITFTASADIASGSITSVKLYWGITSDNLNNTVVMTGSNGSYSVTIPAQLTGTVIYYRIEATGSNMEITSSDLLNFSIQDTNQLPVITSISYSPLYPTPADNLNISVKASDADGIQSVKLYWGVSPDNLLNYSEMVFWSGSYTANITAQSAGTQIYYIIEVEDNRNAITTSDLQSFPISSANTVSLSNTDNNFIYPNPANTCVFVKHESGEWVVLYSVDGKKLIESVDNSIDISGLSKGVYIVRIKNSDGKTLRIGKLLKE
ncbi:MAG: endonuclease [Bacteroidales bacterium]|nr:endonuclease [Bacteroidales bacterium]MCB9012601.1 endonuclease [Bacteroidales bacterium]